MMLDTPAKELITDNRICLPLGEGNRFPDVHHIMLAAWENGAIPVFSEALPHGDNVMSVCDSRVEVPKETAVSSTIKELWAKLQSACHAAPRSSLSEFSMAMVAAEGDDTRLSTRVYLLRFRAGAQEVVHPAVVVTAQ
jgi:hypothetical protein